MVAVYIAKKKKIESYLDCISLRDEPKQQLRRRL